MKKCYCCKEESEKTIKVLGYELCDKCLKDYEEARKEIDKLRK